MGSLSDIVINAVYQLWHLIPIVIIIILIKKFMDKRDRDKRINRNIENEKNGLTLELRTIKKYEDLGYKVIPQKIEDNKEIYLLCSKDNKTFFIQCKDDTKSKSITAEHIKTFYSTAIKYLKSNNMEEKKVEFRYVIPYKEILDKSATKVLEDDFYNCKYVIL